MRPLLSLELTPSRGKLFRLLAEKTNEKSTKKEIESEPRFVTSEEPRDG